jgi:hypothetical protein
MLVARDAMKRNERAENAPNSQLRYSTMTGYRLEFPDAVDRGTHASI